MSALVRDVAIAVVFAPLLVAAIVWPWLFGVALTVLAAVVIGFVMGRSSVTAAPALPEVETVDGDWREVG